MTVSAGFCMFWSRMTWALVMIYPSSVRITPEPAPPVVYWNQALRVVYSVLISTTESFTRAATCA